MAWPGLEYLTSAVIKHGLAPEFAQLPFRLEGDRNVLLETVKRAEDDFDAMTYVEKRNTTKSVILRMHEHMGGRAAVKLVM